MKNNSLKRILLILLGCSSSLMAQVRYENHWIPQHNQFATNATYIMAVNINDETVVSNAWELGAFCNDECRGSAFVLHQNVYDFYSMVIYGNNNDVIKFRLYDHETEREMDVASSTEIAYQENGFVGLPPMPVPVCFTIEENDFNLVTDASQLVSGRRYLLGASMEDGDVLLIGQQSGNLRVAVASTCQDGKLHEHPAQSAVSDYPFTLTLGGTPNAWTLYDDANGKYLAPSNQGLNLQETPFLWTIGVTATGKTMVSDGDELFLCSTNDGFSCLGTDAQKVFLFSECEYLQGEVTDLRITDPKKAYVVKSGDILTVTGALETQNASNLILEDGAQLLSMAENVNLTVQKKVEKIEDDNVAADWYTVSAPMVTASVPLTLNMEGQGTCDLYFFDERYYTEEWRNYKLHHDDEFSNWECGRGYLYANADDVVMNFTGQMNMDEVTYTMTYTDSRPDELKGFALVGNPFTHKIYKGQNGAIDDARLAAGYYTLSHEGVWHVRTYDEPIMPCQSILVKAAEAGTLTIINNAVVATAEQQGQSKGIHGRVKLTVDNGVSQDVACLYVGEGYGLGKIANFNADFPTLSVCNEGKDYAIAFVEPEREAVTLKYVTRQACQVRLTADVKGSDWTSLHLMDNFTGADVNLLANPSYTFYTSGKEHPYRFTLVMKGISATASDAAILCLEGGRVIASNIQGTAVLKVYDTQGRLVECRDAEGNLDVQLHLKQGLYAIYLEGEFENRHAKMLID